MGTRQSASTLGNLKATLKQRSCYKLVIGNWGISSLPVKEHELVKKVKRYSLNVVGMTLYSWTIGANFCSGVEPAKFAQAGVGILGGHCWQVVLMNGSH